MSNFDQCFGSGSIGSTSEACEATPGCPKTFCRLRQAVGLRAWCLRNISRIYVLLPLILATCVVAGIIGAAQGHQFEQIILDCIVIVVCMQFGFLVGALLAVPRKDRPRFPIKKIKVRDETAP